jgi:hypothetical protein
LFPFQGTPKGENRAGVGFDIDDYLIKVEMEDKMFIKDLKYRSFPFGVLWRRTNKVPEGGRGL